MRPSEQIEMALLTASFQTMGFIAATWVVSFLLGLPIPWYVMTFGFVCHFVGAVAGWIRGHHDTEYMNGN